MCGSEGVKYNEEQYNGEQSSTHRALLVLGEMSTRALIEAIPIPDPEIERNKTFIPLSGDLPSPLDPPSGCAFRTRCPQGTALCAEQAPPVHDAGNGHRIMCHFPIKT